MNPRPVAQYDARTGERLAVFPSIKEAAKSVYRGNPASICAVCKGKLKTAYGYGWKYAEEVITDG